MANLPYMPLYVSELFSDMRMKRLKAEEKGIFLLLLAVIWRNEDELENDDDSISMMLEISKKKWIALKEKYMKLKLLHENDFLYLRTTELTKIHLHSQAKSDKAREMANSRWEKEKERKKEKERDSNIFGE
jgi:uncharacterized protein YdaU (DUF1376 family)